MGKAEASLRNARLPFTYRRAGYIIRMCMSNNDKLLKALLVLLITSSRAVVVAKGRELRGMHEFKTVLNHCEKHVRKGPPIFESG